MIAVWVVLLLVVAGCAQVPTGSSDTERLHNAIAVDDSGFVQGLVKSGRIGVNHHTATPGFPEGAPLIVVAARYGSLQTLRYLMGAGADINARAPTGETALMIASYFGGDESGAVVANSRHEQVVRILVEAGASLENDSHHYTPLAYAAYKGHDRIVRYLLERGARVDADAQDGVIYVNTPLMMAAIQGHFDTAVWLLRAGADARVRVYLGHTATELATRHNHQSMVSALRCAESLTPGEKFEQKCARR
jgi:ankyrin repeat protein